MNNNNNNNNNNNSAFRNYSGVQPPDLSTDHKTCLEGVLFVAIYFPAHVTFHFPFNCHFFFFSANGTADDFGNNFVRLFVYFFVIPFMQLHKSPMGGSLRGRRKKGRGEGEGEKSAKANVSTIVRVLIKSVLVYDSEFYDLS